MKQHPMTPNAPVKKISRLIALAAAVWCGLPQAHATTYYVSPAGDDARTAGQAQNLATPWRTINRAAGSMVAGDTCLIRGGTYRETVTVAASGTAGAPITFQNYANELVTIDGSDSLATWTDTGGNIWTAPMGWTLGDENQVFINGAMKPAARWPNAGASFPWQNSSIKPSPDWSYLDTVGYTSGTNGWFTDTALPARADGYWTGATVHILSGKGWIMNHRAVTGYTDADRKILTNDASGSNASYAFTAGNEYYLTGKKGELDSQGEWFYESGTLSVYSTTAPTGVTVKRRNYGFDLRGRAFVRLVNLKFFACTIQTDTASTDHTYDGIVMQHTGCSSVNATIYGLTLRDRCVLRNSELAWDSRSLLTLAGSDIRVFNNHLHDSGYVPNWDGMVSSTGYPFTGVTGSRNLVSHNTLLRSGRPLLTGIGRASIIEYNDLSDAMKLTSDGAVFSMYLEAGNSIFRYNLIHDCPGPKGHIGVGIEGFYLDSQNSNWIVHHNIIWNIPNNKMRVNARNNFDRVFNNTCYGSGGGLITGAPGDGETGTHVFNNLFPAGPSGDWSTSDVRFNLNASPPFTDPANGDFRLKAGSPAIDTGTPVPGVTDGFLGAAPDIGALEYGGVDWTPNVGHSATPLSPEPTYDFPTMIFANQVRDGSFESGSLAPNWTTSAGSAVTLLAGNAWTDTRLRSGTRCLQFGEGTSEISQTVSGLLPNCAYKAYAGIQSTDAATTVRFGVRNSGGSPVEMIVPESASGWGMQVVSFTTGPTSTSAEIYLNVSMPGGAPPVYADDFAVQMNTEVNSGQAYVPAAAPSTWINPLGGAWDTAGNWSADMIPAGTGVTADFSTLDITSDTIVSLDSARTIGNLIFSDPDPSTPASWVVDNHANPANTLTLASGVTPAITVSDLGPGMSATISAIIAGTSGLNKAGNGRLILTGANTFTGDLTVNGGALDLTNRGAANTGAITVQNSGSVLNIATNLTMPTSKSFSMGTSGSVNHTSGTLTMGSGAGGNMLLINGGAVYNLNSGTVKSGNASTNRGVIIGVNTGNGSALAPNTFKLQGGVLDLKTNAAILMVGRSESAATNTHNLFNQTGGTATVGTLTIGGHSGGNNVTSTFTLSGGSFSADNFTKLANGTSDNVAMNLGGSAQVTLPAFPTTRGGSAVSNITLDFTTGYLAPSAPSAAYIPAGTFNNAWLGANGARFNVGSGKDITIGQALSDKPGEHGTLTKTGTGTLTLTGANTYTGDTLVSYGTMELATTGSLRFAPGANGVCNRITGLATVNLKGAFVLDLSNAAIANGNSWNLVNVSSLNETFAASFNIPGFTEIANVWTKVDGARTWTFSEATGTLSLAFPPGYDSWLAGYPGLADTTPGGDPDRDGIANLLEYVLGGNPAASDCSILPTATVTATDFVFTFQRRDESEADTTMSFEYGPDLAVWTSIPLPPASGTVGAVTITVVENGTLPDLVTVSVPRGSNTKLFGRLKATKTP